MMPAREPFYPVFWAPRQTGVNDEICWVCGRAYEEHYPDLIQGRPMACPCVACESDIPHAPNEDHVMRDFTVIRGSVWLNHAGGRTPSTITGLCLRCGKSWGDHSNVRCRCQRCGEHSDTPNLNCRQHSYLLAWIAGQEVVYISIGRERADERFVTPPHMSQEYMDASGDRVEAGTARPRAHAATIIPVVQDLSKPPRILTPAPYLVPRVWNKPLIAFQQKIGKSVVVYDSGLWKSPDSPGFANHATLVLTETSGHNRLVEAAGDNYVFYYSGSAPSPSRLLALLEQARLKREAVIMGKLKRSDASAPSEAEFIKFCVALKRNATAEQDGLAADIQSYNNAIRRQERAVRDYEASIDRLGGREKLKARAAAKDRYESERIKLKIADTLRKLKPKEVPPIGSLVHSFERCDCYAGGGWTLVGMGEVVGSMRESRRGAIRVQLYPLNVGNVNESHWQHPSHLAVSTNQALANKYIAFSRRMAACAELVTGFRSIEYNLATSRTELSRLEGNLKELVAKREAVLARLKPDPGENKRLASEYKKLIGLLAGGKLTSAVINKTGLHVKTAPITLVRPGDGERVSFGAFTARIGPQTTYAKQIAFNGGRRAETPYAMHHRLEHIHPHISGINEYANDGRWMCFGDADMHAKAAINGGRIGDLLVLLCEVIYRYNPASPLASLEAWDTPAKPNGSDRLHNEFIRSRE